MIHRTWVLYWLVATDAYQIQLLLVELGAVFFHDSGPTPLAQNLLVDAAIAVQLTLGASQCPIALFFFLVVDFSFRIR